MHFCSSETHSPRPLGGKLSSIVQRVRRSPPRHDDRLRADRQVTRPRTSLVALINGGRGPV